MPTISSLTELTAPAAGDYIPIVDISEAADADKTKRITVDNLLSYNTNMVFVPLTTPLTSTYWDGDSFSTTAKTLIDLSAVFGAPAGIKAILARLFARDSGSAGQMTLYFGISPNDVNASLAFSCRPTGIDDSLSEQVGICPCDENGDVYYQCTATGSNTLDAWIQIWGYWL